MSANGDLLVYLRPAAMIPALTVELPCDASKAELALTELSSFTGIALSDGVLRAPLGFQLINLAYRDGRLIATTEPGGVDAVLACERGFDQLSDVQAALDPLAEKTSGHLILRHAAMMQQFQPLAGMAGAEAMQQVEAFGEALPEDATWLRWRMDEKGLEATGEGALNALLIPMAAPMLAAPQGIN